jgi:hypothetical protein
LTLPKCTADCRSATLGPAVAGRFVRGGQPSVEPRAAEILNAALNHLAGTASLTLRAEVYSETTLASGVKLQYPGTLEVMLRRPDRLSYRLESEQRRIAAWYDGKSFTLLDAEKAVCASTPAPNGLGPLFDDMASRLGFRPPLSGLLRADAPAPSCSGWSPVSTSGAARSPARLPPPGLPQQNVDLQLWVAAEPGHQADRDHPEEAAVVPRLSTIASWDFNAVLGRRFHFEPPERGSLRDSITGQVGPER